MPRRRPNPVVELGDLEALQQTKLAEEIWQPALHERGEAFPLVVAEHLRNDEQSPPSHEAV